jgi:hypothetical protein
MAWKYPRTRQRNGSPMDVEALNSDMEHMLQDMQGNLNEHNWKSGAFPATTDFTKGACLRVCTRYEQVNPRAALTESPQQTVDVVSGPVLKTETNFQWVSVMSRDVRVDASMLWMMASFQHSASLPSAASQRTGIIYALRLDGIVLTETLLGSGNRVNDSSGEGVDGIGTHMGFVLEAVVPVTSGLHRVELVVRMAMGVEMQMPPADDYWMIHNREIIVMELW